MVVAKKVVKNFTMPEPVWGEFEAMHKKHGYLSLKQKWVILSSAIISLAALPVGFRDAVIAQTIAADASADGFQKLLEVMRSGEFRREFDEKNPPGFAKLLPVESGKSKKGGSRKRPKEQEQGTSSSAKSH
jgi:hypothetical protein